MVRDTGDEVPVIPPPAGFSLPSSDFSLSIISLA